MSSNELYASAEELRAEVGGSSNDHDAQITLILSAVSRMIDGFTGRKETGFQAIQTASSREYAGNGNRYIYLEEFVALTSVKIKTTLTSSTYDKTLAAAEYRAFRGSYNYPNFSDKPYTGIMLTSSASIGSFYTSHFEDYFSYDTNPIHNVRDPNIEITARWGYADSVPEIIRQATIMQSVRIYKRLQGGMADALINDSMGMNRFISKLDKDVESLLKMSGYMKSSFAGR